MYRLILPANRDPVTMTFPICISFHSFSWLTALANCSSTILSKSSGSGRPSCSDLWGNVSLFSPCLWAALVAFTTFGCDSSRIGSGIFILKECFHCIYWDNCDFYHSFCLCDTLLLLIYITCTPRLKSTRSWCMILLTCCEFHLPEPYFVEDFRSL